ncbi:hypothetical protein [Vreelandella piezotolerans]|uniref:hypothetical protein n=1 Tax=Vreelandella piezotolerans TaxID=2609667 RepID=UPI0037B155C7
MAIDPDWVRENPEEAGRQLDLLSKKYDALMSAKLEALPADIKSRYLVIRAVGDISRDEAKEVMQGFAKHSSGVAIFVNREVDLETIDMKSRDANKKAEALEEAANETVPAMHQMANWLRARAAEERRKAKGGA